MGTAQQELQEHLVGPDGHRHAWAQRMFDSGTEELEVQHAVLHGYTVIDPPHRLGLDHVPRITARA